MCKGCVRELTTGSLADTLCFLCFGEALAVIVIFLGQIAAGTSVFNLCAFLLACLVVVLVRIYGLAGKAERAKKPLCPHNMYADTVYSIQCACVG